MTTVEFIDALERRGTLPADLAARLRAKAAAGDHRVTPDAVLKFLVQKDVITDWQAQELTTALLEPLEVVEVDESDVLDLAPLPDDERKEEPRRPLMPPPKSLSTPAPAAPPAAPSARPLPGDDLFAPSPGNRIDDTSWPVDAGTVAGAPKTAPAAASTFRLAKGGAKKGKKVKRTAGGKNQWDSPLLLFGGGGLVLLVVAGVFLYYLMFREGADSALKDANRLFASGAYSQAQAKYEEFIQTFSSHKDASQARVRARMAELWAAVESDPAGSLERARQVIADIEDEPAFISDSGGEDGLSLAKQELGALLVRIGEALAEDAEASADERQTAELIGSVEAVLALSANSKYVPDQFRNDPALQTIREQLAVVRTRLARDADLASALAAMKDAISRGDTAAAYGERRSLLASYPALSDDESLAQAVREATAADAAKVKFAPDERQALVDWPPRPVAAEVALAERRSGTSHGTPGESLPVVVRVDGVLYGLRSNDGALVWRRFAGYGATSAPLLVEGHVIAADLLHGELWRLNASNGTLVWRLPLADKVTGVVAAGSSLLATAESGQIFVVDPASGRLKGSVQLSQPVRVAPSVSDDGERIFVVGEQAVIYTLSSDDLSCLGAYYLGHAAGSVAAPPLAILDKVIVAENVGDSCRLRVLALDADRSVGKEAADDRLTGLVLTPLVRSQRRFAATTTRGEAAIFEISGASDKSALSLVGRRGGQDDESLARFVAIHEGHLWVGGRGLTKLAILPTENQLSVRSLERDFHADAFDAEFQIAGKLVIHVRRPAGRSGVVVGATDASTDAVAWETELATTPAGAPAVDVDRFQLTAATANGAVYVLDRNALTQAVSHAAMRDVASASDKFQAIDSIDLGAGRVAVASVGAQRILHVRPGDVRRAVRAVDLPSPLSCPLVAWRDGFVAATEVGQVFLYDAESAASAATPFQPTIVPDRRYRWLVPAVVGSGDAADLAISDGVERMYLLQIVDQPARRLESFKSVDVGASPLTSPLAATESAIFAGTDDGRLAGFQLPDLTPIDAVDLGARVAWGPHAAAGGLLLATEANELMFIDGAGAIRWRRKSDRGAPAGKPLVADGEALILYPSGGLARVALANGAGAAYVELGQPALFGPIALGPRLVVAAPDGTVLIVNRP